MDIYSWITFGLSLVYVVLISKEKKAGFIFALIASIIWAYTDFTLYNLKFDGFLQVFYAIMAIYGWVTWSKSDNNLMQIKTIQRHISIFLFLLGIVSSIILVPIVQKFTSTDLAYLDAITTVFSIIATFLLIYKFIESWLILLVCNIIYIYIYYVQNAYAYSIMMVIYAVLAIYGYRQWKTANINE